MDDAMLAAYRAGQAAWPGLAVSEERFMRLARKAPAVDAARAADLYLAAACSTGDERALALFQTQLGPQIAHAVGRQAPEAFLDDVRQRLFEKLFTGPEPGILAYAGRGSLAAFVRVAANRAALYLRGQARPHVSAEQAEQVEAPGPDPELGLLKTTYSGELRAALEESMAALEPRDRNVLRLSFLDGLSIDSIAALHHVHRATAARWVQRGCDQLREETRARVASRLKLAEPELDSLMRLVMSQLEVSLRDLKSPSQP
jgi:RNA polymerase sigma-70 factor, ECF subfamily